MTVDGQKDTIIISQKRGIAIYAENPSIPAKHAISRPRKRQFGREEKGMIVNSGTGEILGEGTACFYEMEEVDSERFVKLFMSGVKKAANLSKTGMSIFEILYNQMRSTPNSDSVKLSFYLAEKEIPGLNERTYRRGLRELLENEIIYRSPVEGLFFVDIQCMFNGDRLGFIKAFYRKGTKKPEIGGGSSQLSLPLQQELQTDQRPAEAIKGSVNRDDWL